MERFELVEKIFNTNRYQILTTYMNMVAATEDERDSRPVDTHFKTRGVPLDPSGGMFIQEEDDAFDAHKSILNSVLSGMPHKLATKKMDEESVDDLNKFEFSINAIVEHFSIFNEITFVNQEDTCDVYDTLVLYLDSFEHDRFVSLNSFDIPDEDVEKIQNLIDAIKPTVSAVKRDELDKDVSYDGLMSYFVKTDFKASNGNVYENAISIKREPSREDETPYSFLPEDN